MNTTTDTNKLQVASAIADAIVAVKQLSQTTATYGELTDRVSADAAAQVALNELVACAKSIGVEMPVQSLLRLTYGDMALTI